MIINNINKLYAGNNEAVALYKGDSLLWRNKPKRTNVIAGRFSEPGEYSIKVNNVDTPVTLDDRNRFEVEIDTPLTSCKDMFKGLTTLDEISEFPDTFNVTDMKDMFSGCTGLTSLDVSGFDTSNVTDMSGMFNKCSGLTSLDVSGFDTSNVTGMGYMFSGCSGLTSLDVSGFDTSNVTGMEYMFSRCSGLTSLDVSGFDTSKVMYTGWGTGMAYMFNNCNNITDIDINGFTITPNSYMYHMFENCSGFTDIDFSTLDLSETATKSMFYNCGNLKSFRVGKMRFVYAYGFSQFEYCTNLKSLSGQFTFDTTMMNFRDNPLDNASAVLLINCLPLIDETTTISFNKSTYNTLTEEQIAVATSKGWTVATR